MKTCPNCKKSKSLEFYHKDKNSKDGFSCHCKECRNLSSRTFSKRNYTKRIARKNSESLCKYCSNNRLDNSKLCNSCWFRDKAGTYLGDRTKANILIRLAEEQNYLCPYTKIHLIPGTNMSLDHTIPKSKGGLDDINNYKWVLTDVNYMKRNLSKSHFLELCEIISQRD